MHKIPQGGIYVHSSPHCGVAIPAINFLWLETELDLDAFIPREETFSQISPVVIVWSWEWTLWNSPWINCVLPMIYTPAQASKHPYKLSRAKKGMICCQWPFGNCSEKVFSSSSCCSENSRSAAGSTKQKFLSNFPFFGSAQMHEHPSISWIRSNLWAELGLHLTAPLPPQEKTQNLEEPTRWDVTWVSPRLLLGKGGRSRGEKHYLWCRDKRPDGIQ